MSRSSSLAFTEIPVNYISGSTPSKQVRFRVSDCYALNGVDEADTISLLYVLDVPPFFDTMLIRVLEQLRIGQKLVFLTNVTARRDPRLILATLAAFGVRVDQVSVRELPYSLSRHDFAFTRAICPTLVVSATLERPFDPSIARVYATAKLETMIDVLAKPIFPGQSGSVLPLGDLAQPAQKVVVARALAHAFAEKSYVRFKQILADELGAFAVEPLVTYLCTRCLMMLTCVRGSG